MATCRSRSRSRRHLFPFLFILSGYCQFVWVTFLLYVPSGKQPLAHRLTSSLSSSSCTCHLVMAFTSGWKKKKSTSVQMLNCEVWVWKRTVQMETTLNLCFETFIFPSPPPTTRVVKSPSSNHYMQILFGM